MVLTVDAEKSRSDPIPQGAGRDALRLESQPGRRGQPMVAQRGVRTLVAQNLRPVRAHGDWELLTRLLERLVGGRRSGRVLVGHGGQVGFENGRALDADDGHGGLLFRDAFMVWPRRGDR